MTGITRNVGCPIIINYATVRYQTAIPPKAQNYYSLEDNNLPKCLNLKFYLGMWTFVNLKPGKSPEIRG